MHLFFTVEGGVMYPSKEEALQILYKAERSNPGDWVQHSLAVALCAEKIATACGLLANKAYVLGLLHDIGRYPGRTYFKHVVDGYEYMMSLGYDEVARVCLSHSFPTQDINGYLGRIDVSKQVYESYTQKLQSMSFDVYDALIQLCDNLAGTQIMHMEERMADVESRYRPFPKESRQKYKQLKADFEQRANKNIYEIVSDESTLWGL